MFFLISSKEQIQNDVYLHWVKLPTSSNLNWEFKITIWSAGMECIRE